MSAVSDADLRSAVEAALATVPDPCMDLAGAPTSARLRQRSAGQPCA